MIIKTERLILRPFEEKDFKETFDIYKDPNTCQYLLHEPWESEIAQIAFSLKLAHNQLDKDKMLNLAVVYMNKVIGDISIWYTEMKETVEIGYSFNHLVAKRGFATEAMQGLIQALFSELSIHRIQTNIDSRNKESILLCERLGMRKEAYHVQNFWNKGEWTDSLVFGMLQSDQLNVV